MLDEFEKRVWIANEDSGCGVVREVWKARRQVRSFIESCLAVEPLDAKYHSHVCNLCMLG